MRLGCLLGCQNQRIQGYQRFGQLQERVSQHLVCCGSLLHLNLQTFVEEVLEDRRQLVTILDLRLPVGGNEIQSSERILIQVRRLPLDHFYGHDSERPDINLKLFSHDDLEVVSIK